MSTSLRPFFLYEFFSEFLLIAPILVPFYRSNGLTALEVFLVQSAYSTAQLLCEVPSGYLADVIGRKRTLVLGAALFVAGLALYAGSTSFGWFVAAEVVLGVGGAMRSGADSALLFDTLKTEGRELEYLHVEGRAQLVTRTGTALSSVLGGLLASVSLRLPFLANVAAATVLLAAATAMREPARPAVATGRLHEIVTVVRRSLRSPTLRPVLLLSALTMATGITAIWGYFLYFTKAGLPLASFGVVFALLQAASGLGSRAGGAVEKRLGGAQSLGTVILIAASLLPFGLVTSLWVLPFAFLHMALWGLSWPLLLARVNRAATSDVRSTVLSTGALLGRILYVAMGVAFGRTADCLSIGTAFLGLAALHVAAAVMLVASVARSEARAGQRGMELPPAC